MKAYSYLRFSTPEQALGDSERRQVEKAEAWAAAKCIPLDKSYADRGKSGFKGTNRKRGALGRFLKQIKAGNIPHGSYLLVEDLDRLSREHPLDSLVLFKEIISAGITIVVLKNNEEYSNATLRADGSALPQDAYDFDGNLKSGRLPANQTENSGLTWDAENRLVEVRVGTNGPLVRYAYDSQSRRIARSVGTSTTIYLYDGWNVIAEYEGAGLAKTYIWGTDLSGTMQGAGGVGGLLAVKSVSVIHYPTFDGNGNVSEYLDGNGAPAAHFEYDPFGNTVVNTDTAGLFPYRFSTKPIDAATGLYYYGYRWYDAPNGRWPSRDPIEEEGGMNLYGFVENHGLDGWDRLGLEIDEFPEPKIKYWKKLDAETTSNWRVNPKKRKLWFKDKWEVSIKGKISPVKVTLDKRTENDITEDGKTVKEHELHHVELRKEAWNALRDKTHPYEGVYCDEPCAQIAHDLMVNYNAYYGSQSIKKNAQFDLDVYGKRLKKEDKNEYDRIESRRDLGQNGMEIAEKSLNTLLLQWKNKKCKKE